MHQTRLRTQRAVTQLLFALDICSTRLRNEMPRKICCAARNPVSMLTYVFTCACVWRGEREWLLFVFFLHVSCLPPLNTLKPVSLPFKSCSRSVYSFEVSIYFSFPCLDVYVFSIRVCPCDWCQLPSSRCAATRSLKVHVCGSLFRSARERMCSAPQHYHALVCFPLRV